MVLAHVVLNVGLKLRDVISAIEHEFGSTIADHLSYFLLLGHAIPTFRYPVRVPHSSAKVIGEPGRSRTNDTAFICALLASEVSTR